MSCFFIYFSFTFEIPSDKPTRKKLKLSFSNNLINGLPLSLCTKPTLGISTHGCWNVVPGLYAMPDGSACKPPVGAPSNTTAVPTVISSSGVATAVTTGHGPVVTSSTGSGSGNGSGSGSNTGSGAKSTVAPTSAGSRLGESIQVLGSAAALVLIVAANL